MTTGDDTPPDPYGRPAGQPPDPPSSGAPPPPPWNTPPVGSSSQEPLPAYGDSVPRYDDTEGFQYPPSPEPPSQGWQEQTGQQPSSEERNWATAAHVGSFVAAWIALGLVAPLLVLLFKGNDSAFVRRHAVESLNFQINALVYTVVFALLILVVIGILLLPLYGLVYLIMVIRASMSASRGEDFRYPLTMRFVS